MHQYLPCLKELQLSSMQALVRTPDFGGLPCLQKLKLKNCESLEEIHQSLGNHSSLVFVEVSHCKKLTRFPRIVGMDKLEILEIGYCKALVEFPKIEAKMDNLVELYLDEIGIEVIPSSVGKFCTNLISLKLVECENLKSIEGNFQALKCLENLCCLQSRSIGKGFHSQLPRSLRKLDLSCCGLNDGEMPTEISELSNLQELDLSRNDFTRLDFSLSRLTSLKLLDVSYCPHLVELPELPSSLAILKASWCGSLEAVIRDEIHRNCKWLSQVSIIRWRKNKNMIGGDRLLETMLQGNVVESGCMILSVSGPEIARGFEPRLVRWPQICRMQLPDNWCNDFSGFLICVVSNAYFEPTITMKHVEKLEGDSQHVVYWVENRDNDLTWVWYISFGLLRNTLWWDPTSTSLQMEMEIESSISFSKIRGWGIKLVQMGTTTTPHSSSEISLDDDYKYKLDVKHDSKSAFKFRFI